MAGSHEKLPRVFWVQIALVLIVGMFYIFTPSPKGHGDAEATPADLQMLAALEPIGNVEIMKEAAEAGPARTGADTSKRVCAVCHSIGLANAPKLEAGAKADWEARMAGDVNNLVQSAIKGKGGMPARGGDPSLTDEEMYLAVADMLSTAGIEVAAAPEAIVAVEEKPAATVAVVAKTGEETVKGVCAVCHSIGLVNAPKLDATAKADWETRIAGGMDALVQSAIKGKGAMPPRGGDANLTDGEVRSAIVVMLGSAGIEVAAAPVVETALEVVAPVAEVPAPSIDSVVATKLGESTYKSSCFACHDTGAANSPVLADKLAWKPRLEAGTAALYASALKGKGAMPAKGGNPTLSDEVVIEAVNYMIINSK